MFKLIKNELKKIFYRKSTYIFLAILFIIIEISTASNNDKIVMANENDFEKENIVLNKYSVEDIKYYLAIKTTNDVPMNVRKDYGAYSWQEFVILSDYQVFYEKLYPYTYVQNYNDFIENNKDALKENHINLKDIKYDYDVEAAKKEFDEINDIFKSDNWQEAAKIMIEIDEKKLEDLKSNIDLYTDEEYEIQNRNIEIKIEEKEYRLEKDVKFGYDYLNTAISDRFFAIERIEKYEKLVEENAVTYADKIEYQSAKEQLAKNSYVIETRNNTENTSSVRFRVANYQFEYSICLAIMTLVVSATIMSGEYNKDTMKQLLLKPYSRTQIFFAKLITCFIIYILSNIFVLLCTFIANVLWFGTDTLKIPMIIYNFTTDKIMEMNIFKYILIRFVVELPKYLGIIFIGFACSTVIGNSLISFVVALLTYSGTFASFILPTKEVPSLYILLLSRNWDFSRYLYGKIPEYENFAMNKSIIVCLIYFAIIMIPAFLYFKKADIKGK